MTFGNRQSITVKIEAQTAADLHKMCQQIRALASTSEELDARLRSAELALAGGLRSLGWTPVEGRWQRMEAPR